MIPSFIIGISCSAFSLFPILVPSVRNLGMMLYLFFGVFIFYNFGVWNKQTKNKFKERLKKLYV